MKFAAYSLLCAALACAGCMTWPKPWGGPKPMTEFTPTNFISAADRHFVLPKAPVTPEQVTDSNAPQMASALLDEMDREASGAVSSPTDSTTPPEKPKTKTSSDRLKSK